MLTAICTGLAPLLSRLPFEKRPKLPSIAPSDIRLTGSDQSAPFSHLVVTAQMNGNGQVDWDRTKFRDSSKATKEAAPKRRHETKQLYSTIDAIIDAHNAGRAYKLPVFALYSTNRAVDVPHNRMQRRVMPKVFRRLMGLENALETKTDFRRAVGFFDLLEQRELREQRDNDSPEASRCLDAVRRAIVAMIPGVTNPRIDSKTGRFAVDSADPNGVPIRLHLDQLSDGYQVMLGVVMDFALRLALANPPSTPADDVLQTEAIMIVDEVDLHLHPLWQQRVIPDLRRTFPNTQLILTTHSPQVATTVPSQSLMILKNGNVFTAPAGTEGAEAERLLEDVFQVNPRPDLPMSRKLTEYLRLVDQGKWNDPEAIELRQQLDRWSQGQEPMLLEADLRIENMKWEAGQ